MRPRGAIEAVVISCWRVGGGALGRALAEPQRDPAVELAAVAESRDAKVGQILFREAVGEKLRWVSSSLDQARVIRDARSRCQYINGGELLRCSTLKG